MRDFHSLKVWEKAHRLTLQVYRASESFPAVERYGLTTQARRAAASIAANIAEGCGRESEADFVRFLSMSLGSATELEYHLILARDLTQSSVGRPHAVGRRCKRGKANAARSDRTPPGETAVKSPPYGLTPYALSLDPHV
jgi:four helix bundle protein